MKNIRYHFITKEEVEEISDRIAKNVYKSVLSQLYDNMRNLALCLLAVTLLSGCKTTKYIEVPTVRTEYIVRSDTISTKDSVYFFQSDTIRMVGDTLFVTKWRIKEKTRDVYRVIVDTVLRTDSVSVPVPVEKDYTFWDKARLSLFWPLLAISLLGICVVVWRIVR